MKRQTHILLAVGIGLLAFTSLAVAQEQQWLQYRSARELSMMGGVKYQAYEPSTEKPLGVELPQFNVANPSFTKWSTPMVKAGRLWIALDSTREDGKYDLLYIDSNCNGRLDDETAVTAYRQDQKNIYFGPVKVIFESEDGPVTYHLNFRIYEMRADLTVFFASAGGWYEGDITVSGEKKHCVLFDYNANGTFNDKSANAAECDRIRIGKEGGQDVSFVGNYIQVGRILYRPEIARDGACIKLTRAEDVKFGSVRLPESVTQLSANGENGLFTLKPEKGIASLPVGQYHIYGWAVERQDDEGAKWALNAHQPDQTIVFDISEGNETELSAGEPIVATLEVYEDKGTYSFHHIMKGRDGEHLELSRNGNRPQAPKVCIKSANGKYDRTYSLEYG